MTDTRTRTFTLDRKAGRGNCFPAVATTESPVKRDFGWEVLDMSRMDLSRAPFPLIESHDQSAVNIGVFELPFVDADKLRGTIRLGKSTRAQELSNDIREGIVSSVSIGYEATDPIESGDIDGEPVYRFASRIFEVSLVSIPADINSGIFRGTTMETETQTRSERKRNTAENEAEEMRIRRICAMGDAADLSELADKHIVEGLSYEEFRRAALVEVGIRNDNAKVDTTDYTSAGADNRISFAAGMPADSTRFGRAMEQYSVLKVLRSLADPKSGEEAGLERELSKEMERFTGVRRQGIVMPYEAIQRVRDAHSTRAVTISGSGSNLVATDHLAGSFIDVLRNRSRVMALNPTILSGLQGDVDIPKKTAGAAAFWIGGDNADAITESDLTLSQVNLSPNTVGGAVTFSHKTIIQSSPDIEAIVRGDLSDLIASEIDLKAINGTGSSNQPTGILNVSGVGSTTYANGGSPDFDDIVALETTICTANADGNQMAYLTTPTLAGALKTTPRQGSGVEGNFVWQNQRMNDLAAYKSGNMAAGYILLGNWSDLLVGFWGGITIDVDPYGSNFLKGSITARIIADLDINVRYAAAFAEIHEAAP